VSSLTRQVIGAALPFTAVPMYRSLGIGWASSLLGFVAVGMSWIPFFFFGSLVRGFWRGVGGRGRRGRRSHRDLCPCDLCPFIEEQCYIPE